MAGGQAEFVRCGSGGDGDLSAGEANVHDHGCERFVFAVGEGGDGSGECEGAGVGDDHARISATAARGGAGSVLDANGEGVQPGRTVVLVWLHLRCSLATQRRARKKKAPGVDPGAFLLVDSAWN